MNISIDKLDGLEKKMQVSIPAAEFDSAFNKKFKSVAKTITMPGFRKGKIPANVIQNRYGGAIFSEVAQDLISEALQKGMKEHECNPVAMPRVNVTKSERGQPLEFEALFEEFPVIDTQDLSKTKIAIPEVSIADSDVEVAIEDIRRQQTQWEEADKKSENGDRVTVNFVGTIDKEPFDGGTANDFHVVLGSGGVIPEFDKALVGVKAGQKKKAKVTFPEDYHSKALAGKKAEFALDVQQVSVAKLPEVDAEFIKKFGVESGEIADFTAQVRQPLETEASRMIDNLKQERVFSALEKAYAKNVTVPKALVREEMQHTAKHSGVELPTDIQPGDKHEIAEGAEKKVMLSLVCQHLLEEYKVELDKERFEAYVKSLAGSYMAENEFMQWFYSDKKRVEQVQASVLQLQLVDAVLEKASTSKEKMDFETLKKQVNG
jgi:trigger factor